MAAKDKDSAVTEDELRAKHKRVLLYNTEDHGLVAFRPPTRPEYQRLMSALTDDKGDAVTAITAFVRGCRAHPSADKFERFLDDYPGVVSDAGAKLQAMSIPDLEGVVKKGR